MTHWPGRVLQRIHADFLMASRLPTYRRLLETVLGAGYAVVSIETFRDRVRAGSDEPGQRVLILRHDIDTDPDTGRKMWEIEEDLGIRASFFFRLSTLDIPLMRAIADGGGHASYHYEELATVAKRHRLRSRGEIDRHLDEIRREFLRNVESVRARTGLPLDIVASHGDFVNRRLGIPNWFLLDDPAFRREAGIALEAYDDALMGRVTSRHSDTAPPRAWVPESPLAAIGRAEPVVHVLVHPRHWRVAPWVNARDDLGRLRESLAYRRPAAPRVERTGR
ncbi:MAG TPA: hypothetical protein VK194_05550 [Candidatus Deferrimicrobium sp.]|nr:hypothetical protein [Candidatus Deferrimicrobium sp.]